MFSAIFPVFCLGCEKFNEFICFECAKAARINPEQKREGFSFHSSFRYEGLIAEALHRAKQQNQFGYIKVLAGLLGESLQMDKNLCLVPPSTSRAFRKRGFNPSFELAKLAGFNVSREILRIRQTDYQQGLDSYSRQNNIENAFKVKKRGSFFLFDDVVTTGATIREMRRAVEDAGGEVAGIFALCSTSPKGAN